jgi:hypothetical protein
LPAICRSTLTGPHRLAGQHHRPASEIGKSRFFIPGILHFVGASQMPRRGAERLATTGTAVA